MWTKIFQEYVSDHVAFVVHVYLLSGDVLATWAVAAGIIWENISDIRHIAHRLVIWGVALETICSLALFTFDEGISVAQQSRIAYLESPRALTQEQGEELASIAAKYVGTTFATRVTPDPDSVNLVGQIQTVLLYAKWNQENGPGRITLGVLGHAAALSIAIGVHINFASDHETQFAEVSRAIAAALNSDGIEADAEAAPPQDDIDHNAITITVGAKPSRK